MANGVSRTVSNQQSVMQTIAERERMEEERLAEQAREQERLKSRKVWCMCQPVYETPL